MVVSSHGCWGLYVCTIWVSDVQEKVEDHNCILMVCTKEIDREITKHKIKFYSLCSWAHQVRSHSRNIAVNIWWAVMRGFNYSDCEHSSGMLNFNIKFSRRKLMLYQLPFSKPLTTKKPAKVI
jgi:hypothetical protein